MIFRYYQWYKWVDRPGLKRLTCVSPSLPRQRANLRFSLSHPMREKKSHLQWNCTSYHDHWKPTKNKKRKRKHPTQQREKACDWKQNTDKRKYIIQWSLMSEFSLATIMPVFHHPLLYIEIDIWKEREKKE